jgi:hypothetical protein
MSMDGSNVQSKREIKNPRWILLKTSRGFFENPRLFRTKKAAESQMRKLRKEVSPDYDGIELFAMSECVWEQELSEKHHARPAKNN